jgi:pilus assembly protein Flp/PilA
VIIHNKSEPISNRYEKPWSVLMTSLAMRFLRDRSGATAIEYGLIAAGISVAIIAVVNGLGTKLTDTFSSVTNNMK